MSLCEEAAGDVPAARIGFATVTEISRGIPFPNMTSMIYSIGMSWKTFEYDSVEQREIPPVSRETCFQVGRVECIPRNRDPRRSSHTRLSSRLKRASGGETLTPPPSQEEANSLKTTPNLRTASSSNGTEAVANVSRKKTSSNSPTSARNVLPLQSMTPAARALS